MRYPFYALCTALVLLVAACGGSDEEGGTPTTEPAGPTSTQAPNGTDPGDDGTDPGDADPWHRCDNPDGFSLSYPPDWETNDGDVVGPCSQFDPEPFEVPQASDERVAVINAYVDEVAFADAAAPGPHREETQRAVTVVDGRQAVRLEGPAGELYGEDTLAVRYLVDVPAGGDGAQRTLVIDAVERSRGDFDRAVEVLDRMVRSIDLQGADGTVDGQTVVARYAGGGTPFAAGAVSRDGEHCVTVPLEGDSVEKCFSLGGRDDVRFTDLSTELLPVLGGITGADVFRVDVRRADGTTLSALPVPVEGGEARGFAVPIGPDDVTGLVWSSVDGTQLGARDLDGESDVAPVAAFEPPPLSSESFPAAGAASLLGDVRVSAHDGFDRVVFEFAEAGDDLTWRVELTDEVLATSGEPVPIDGDRILRVVMTPASGVDLSGAQPRETYDGPDRIDPASTTVVRQLALIEDFENNTSWGIGVPEDARVAIAELDHPRRLVVDVRAG